TPPKYFVLLLQDPDRDFLEKHNVVIAVVLQADVTLLRARSALRFKFEFLGRHRSSLSEISDSHAVQHHNRVRPIESDFHGVPLRPGFARTSQRLGERI